MKTANLTTRVAKIDDNTPAPMQDGKPLLLLAHKVKEPETVAEALELCAQNEELAASIFMAGYRLEVNANDRANLIEAYTNALSEGLSEAEAAAKAVTIAGQQAENFVPTISEGRGPQSAFSKLKKVVAMCNPTFSAAEVDRAAREMAALSNCPVE